MQIAIFDYLVTPNNAIGNCHRTMVRALAGEHDFTIFSCALDNPAPNRVRWMPLAAITRPLAALFVTYHLTASWIYWRHRVGRRENYQWVQGVESNFLFADIVAAHFCHRWFLEHHWKRCGAPGLRGLFRWIDHYLHALVEPTVFRRAQVIVVPSAGLKRELTTMYPDTRDKIHIVPNMVDAASMVRPADFDRDAVRRQSGAGPDDLLLSFVALGHYERKGLPALLSAIARRPDLPLKLVVIGGQPDLVREYEARTARMGIAGRVRFMGMQKDTRPFFWASDAFVFPSLYETFSIVAFEAAAAGCPLLVPQLNGVEEFLVDGETGILITPDAEGVERGLERLAKLSPTDRQRMVERAAACVSNYNLERYVAGWRSLYASLPVGGAHRRAGR